MIMVWFLPLILIGGIFVPLLGYLVVGMMAFFLVLAVFKGRYWCWNLCPRGSFLDMVISKASLNKPYPRIFGNQLFRWSVFFAFMAFLVYRILRAGGSLVGIGAVFVSMCLITTAISIIIGLAVKHRGWCAICPMGTLQEKIGNIRRGSKEKR
ncbi:MAG: 4Fe-4S binding protein [Candidatus Omnitrophota bacterium]